MEIMSFVFLLIEFFLNNLIVSIITKAKVTHNIRESGYKLKI